MSGGDCLTVPRPEADPQDPAQILRFRISERHMHWAIAVPFMVCWATALVLVTIYNPDPTRPYRALFSWVHRLSGVSLGVGPILVLLRHHRDYRIHLSNMLTVWRWRFDDLKWLVLMGPSTVSKRIALPHQEKFNAAEKINFMMLTATWPVYVATGVLIWLPGVAFLSWLVHLSMAAAATPLILGHLFMAIVNPDTRVGLSGMITGYVDRHWAHHHYHHWFEKTFPHLIHAAPAANEATSTDTEPGVLVAAAPAEIERVPSALPERAPSAIVTAPITRDRPAPLPEPGDEETVGVLDAGWPPFLRPPSTADSVGGTA